MKFTKIGKGAYAVFDKLYLISKNSNGKWDVLKIVFNADYSDSFLECCCTCKYLAEAKKYLKSIED